MRAVSGRPMTAPTGATVCNCRARALLLPKKIRNLRSRQAVTLRPLFQFVRTRTTKGRPYKAYNTLKNTPCRVCFLLNLQLKSSEVGGGICLQITAELIVISGQYGVECNTEYRRNCKTCQGKLSGSHCKDKSAVAVKSKA